MLLLFFPVVLYKRLFGVSPRFIVGLLLRSLYLCDLFYELNDLGYASFPDDTTLGGTFLLVGEFPTTFHC